ncbi:hypothetical protein D3C87_1915310 [compost metagenome]
MGRQAGSEKTQGEGRLDTHEQALAQQIMNDQIAPLHAFVMGRRPAALGSGARQAYN